MAGRGGFSLSKIFTKEKQRQAIHRRQDLYKDDESENDLYCRINKIERSQREVREQLEKILQNQQKLLENQQILMSTGSSPQRPTQTVSLSRATGMAQAHQLRQLQHKPTESTNAVEELSQEKTEATQTIKLKRSTSEVQVTVRFNEAGLDTRWRSQPLVNKAQEHTVIDADREALRKVLKEEIPKTHRQGKVVRGCS